MGSVCLKVTNGRPAEKLNKVMSRTAHELNSELKPAAMKQKINVLSIKKTFLVRKHVETKPSQDSEVRVFVQQYAQPVSAFQARLQSLQEACNSEKSSAESCRSPSPESRDSWTQNRSPRGFPVSLTGAVPVFRTKQHLDWNSKKPRSLESIQTASKTPSDLDSGLEDKPRLFIRATQQKICMDFDRVLQGDTCDYSPKSLGTAKISKVTKIRKELKRLALDMGSC